MRDTMPSARTRRSFTRRDSTASAALGEAMVADARGSLTPAELVEQKVASTLKTSPLPISSLRTMSRVRRPK